MEVIAKRNKGIRRFASFVIGFSVFLFAFGILNLCMGLDLWNIRRAAIFIAQAITFFVMYAYIRRSYNQTREEIIIYDGTHLICPDGSYLLSELHDVTCKRLRGWGTIELYINGVKHSYSFVADVEKVQSRLMELKRQAENGEI